ncbi:metal-dependent transcriptional regulator [Halopenitus persicus]|uniref:Iron (Metal) dependent repressor, DtxR family n=1 Tax=Halopenitus persicus TaxID=1048396 RepID=A0A1H3M9P9_9EURY|nr:metal-dependent transcriptional regulator [Halopenitus persicus]SDY73313.1 iron (metal) dependent repressor, DtxR family [Halopenitus persicus]
MGSRDRYLKVIYALERTRVADTFIATGAVADVLDVHPSSATEMFAKLESDGLLHYEKYTGVTLTDAGRDRGRALLENSCLIQRFLRDVLEVTDYREEARAIEPVLNADVADRLSLLIDRPPECPDCFDGETGRCSYLDE